MKGTVLFITGIDTNIPDKTAGYFKKRLKKGKKSSPRK